MDVPVKVISAPGVRVLPPPADCSWAHSFKVLHWTWESRKGIRAWEHFTDSCPHTQTWAEASAFLGESRRKLFCTWHIGLCAVNRGLKRFYEVKGRDKPLHSFLLGVTLRNTVFSDPETPPSAYPRRIQALLFQTCQVLLLSTFSPFSVDTKAAQTTGMGRKGSPASFSFPSFAEGWSGISSPILRAIKQEELQLPADSQRAQEGCFGTGTAQTDLEIPPQVPKSFSMSHLTLALTFKRQQEDVLIAFGFNGQVLWMETEAGQSWLYKIFALLLPN